MLTVRLTLGSSSGKYYGMYIPTKLAFIGPTCKFLFDEIEPLYKNRGLVYSEHTKDIQTLHRENFVTVSCVNLPVGFLYGKQGDEKDPKHKIGSLLNFFNRNLTTSVEYQRFPLRINYEVLKSPSLSDLSMKLRVRFE